MSLPRVVTHLWSKHRWTMASGDSYAENTTNRSRRNKSTREGQSSSPRESHLFFFFLSPQTSSAGKVFVHLICSALFLLYSFLRGCFCGVPLAPFCRPSFGSSSFILCNLASLKVKIFHHLPFLINLFLKKTPFFTHS